MIILTAIIFTWINIIKLHYGINFHYEILVYTKCSIFTFMSGMTNQTCSETNGLEIFVQMKWLDAK